MKKTQERIVGGNAQFDIVRYSYIFDNEKEYDNYKLEEDERFIRLYYTMNAFPTLEVETVRKTNQQTLVDVEGFDIFRNRLARIEVLFDLDSDKVLGWLKKFNFEDQQQIVQLCNKFYNIGG